MFPFHLNNDSPFQISCDLQEQDTVDQQDLIWGHESLEGSNPAQEMGKGKQHIISPTSENNEASVLNNEKKITRRDIERERRMQMSTHCASLRSLLPFELIKGKRSVSDHIGEATKYILYLKEKIDVLHIKRDKLRQIMVNPSMVDAGIESSNRSSLVNCVKIDPLPGGVEIVIDSGFEESSPPLSHILEILHQEGYNVVSCISTKVNGRIVHSIKSEVGCLTHLDLAGMQQKLNNAIFPSRYI
ncbi:hypothetical protein L6164_006158 [Bauhinia variegata]|uniref:Uncharacterized protein n=1 Tax=Bauhinia variegata TaxID=167791 RepID=A0ACB9PV09_BAUVA|nr:hypothetical protein L6164_006158 [Bauhinia variegata]